VNYVVAVTMLALLAGCQSTPVTNVENKPPAAHRAEYAQDASLYRALGEREGISDFVRDMLYIVLEDERVRLHFKGLDIVEFHQNLTVFVCQISGGPCQYRGKNMVQAHKGMNINETEFNAVVNNLVLAMEQNGVSVSAKNRLLARLAPLHDSIVDQ
jgi:hemoglobin